jgi:L-cysteine:1D-myo-inositol 2-amino-2-deoxy-alpha-D-glucopyranoside ligase
VQSWPAPTLPALPHGPGLDGPPLRLFDTAGDEVRPVSPGEQARVYVCGITPYDATHLGHALTYLTYDTVIRVLRDAGVDVAYTQNVTDVDDPLLERANRDGEDWEALAAREIQLFRDDSAWLRVIPPTDYVGAVEAIPMIVEFVQRLVDAGATYVIDGDVYFSVAAAPHLGQVAHGTHPELVELARERGGDPDRAGKKDPLDPILWLAARPGEPSWPSPFGPGRPGWHVECAAIALDTFGGTLDIQGGGTDLVFPHHELGAAHAESLGHEPFARLYVHVAMLAYQGAKMSKSLGNLVFVSRLREAGVDPGAVRLALFADRYRDAREWQDGDLDAAVRRLGRWREAVALPAGPPAGPVLAEVRRALADDLDTPQALRAIDQWASVALGAGGSDPAAPQLIRDTVDALLGVLI